MAKIVMHQQPGLLTEQQVADMLAVSRRTVQSWRATGYGPQPIKLANGRGGAVRYRPEAVEAFLRGREAAAVGGFGAAGAAGAAQ